jgi:chorismate mutase
MELEEIRGNLENLEDIIIVSFLGRAQYKANNMIYSDNSGIQGFSGSFLDYMLKGTESLHSALGRYDDYREYPFFGNLPDSIMKRRFNNIIDKIVNKNSKIKEEYVKSISAFCKVGDDNEYGDSAVWDILSLQNISKRVHFGAVIAENKLLQNPKLYEDLVLKSNFEGIKKSIRNGEVEEKILKRVFSKAKNYKVNPGFVLEFYKNTIIPLTIDVETDYITKRVMGKFT